MREEMGSYVRFFLLLFTSFSKVNNNAGVQQSEFCLFESCPLLRLTCPSNTNIVIFDEQRAFQYADGVTNEMCTSKCNSNCCQSSKFQCFNQVNSITFSHTFFNCWNNENCTHRPTQENRVYTDIAECRSSSSPFGNLTYDCIASSSVRDFTDPNPVVGGLLMASFDSSSMTYPSCVRPNVSLECLVENANGLSESNAQRLMLVMNHTLTEGCTKLHLAAGSFRSPDMPCRNAVEFVTFETMSLPLRFTLTPQNSSPKSKAWAVVKGLQTLKMTCGQTCQQSTAAPPSSSPSTPRSSTTTSPQPESTSPTEPGSTAPQSVSTRPPSSIDVVSQPAPFPTTGFGTTSMETAGGEAINTPVIASLAVLSVLLASALAVAVCVNLRQRRTPADDTYARTLPVPAEDRTYASLHSDPGPRHQVVSLEPLSGAQPVPGPARGDHSRAPQYENMTKYTLSTDDAK